MNYGWFNKNTELSFFEFPKVNWSAATLKNSFLKSDAEKAEVYADEIIKKLFDAVSVAQLLMFIKVPVSTSISGSLGYRRGSLFRRRGRKLPSPLNPFRLTSTPMSQVAEEVKNKWGGGWVVLNCSGRNICSSCSSHINLSVCLSASLLSEGVCRTKKKCKTESKSFVCDFVVILNGCFGF